VSSLSAVFERLRAFHFGVFPCYRVESGNSGDGFAQDCPHYHAVARIPRLRVEAERLYAGIKALDAEFAPIPHAEPAMRRITLVGAWT